MRSEVRVSYGLMDGMILSMTTIRGLCGYHTDTATNV
jgi:hypothetical protein